MLLALAVDAEPRDPKRQLWALVETLQSGSTARQPLPEHRKTGTLDGM